jgi:hypothetical protein
MTLNITRATIIVNGIIGGAGRTTHHYYRLQTTLDERLTHAYGSR